MNSAISLPCHLFSSHLGTIPNQAFCSSGYSSWILCIIFFHHSGLEISQFTENTKISGLGFCLEHDSTLFHMFHSPDCLVFTNHPKSSSLLKQETQCSFHVLSRALVPSQSTLALSCFFFFPLISTPFTSSYLFLLTELTQFNSWHFSSC